MNTLIDSLMKNRLVRKYTGMQHRFYVDGTSDHLEHNQNPDYWTVLLQGLSDSEFMGGRALDFGCGKGRNIFNLRSLETFSTVDGSDLSPANIDHCEKRFDERSSFFLTSGSDCGSPHDDYYDFVMSTITLQHIPVYSIRALILTDILRCLKPGGRLSFQMGFGSNLEDSLGRPRSGYFENCYSAVGTNGDHDCRVTSVEELKSDLLNIGFVDIKIEVKDSYSDVGHPNWVYAHAFKEKSLS
jgi:SAM-dependent methyltransferase